ncbi:hypothetical protein MACJ_002513 [Theileria orientalis]|uniref:SfiI-subtelomeric related protein family member n=1 Tax=Theileria orientalis TaxID=68886 RepID=A0A976QSR4_THEOR|nr:hypothetical protein MACJ_002513 [Theileria orientalis]
MNLWLSTLWLLYLSARYRNNFVKCKESLPQSRTYHSRGKFTHKLIKVDIKNLFSTSELVYDYNPSGNSHTFTPNPGYLINKVTKRDTVLWDAKNYSNVYSNRVFVGFNESLEQIFRVYFPGEPPKLSVPITPKPLEPKRTKPTLITLDVKIKETTDEIDYEFNYKRQTHTFTPNPGFAIDRVVKGSRQVWECEDGVYPEKVLIILDEDDNPVLRFQFPEPVRKVKPIVRGPEKSSKEVYELVDLDVDPMRSTGSCTRDLILSYGRPYSHDPRGRRMLTGLDLEGSGSQPDETSSDSDQTGSSTPKTGVDLDITSDTRTTKEFEYKKYGQYVTYLAKGNNSFKLVKDGTTEVWKETDSTKYSSKVEVDLINNDSKAVTIYFPDNKTKVFVKDSMGSPWKEIDTSKANAMSVYVDYSHDSYICENVLNGDTRTFTAKSGFTFKGAHEYINDNRVAIWKADNDSEHVNKIEVDLINNDSKAVTIHFGENRTKVFMKNSMCRPWKEIDTSKINLRPIDIQYKYDCYFYTNNLDNGVRTFTAKTGFFFNRVKDDNTNIWTSKKKEFAEKVVVETNNRLIIYIGDDGHAKVFDKKENGTWIEHIERQRVRLFKANPSNTANPLQLGANEYTSSTSGNMVSYHIVEGVNCVQLFFDDVLLWVYDSTQHGGIYPKSVYHDTTTNVLILRFTGLDMTFENTHDGWIYTESGPLAVKFHVVDPNNPNNTVELASNQFTVTEIGDVTTFNIADGVNCIALSYGPALLWQHDPNQRGGRYPNSLYYIQSTNRLLLRFDDLFMTFLKNDQGEWVYTETYTPGMGADAPESGYCTPCEEDRFSTTGDEDPDTQSIASSTVTAQSRLRLFKVNPRNAANPLELSANEYTSTATGNVVTYNIASGVNCTQLKFGDVLLWEHDPNQRFGIYPRSVYHDTTNNVLVLRFTGLAMTFENTSEGWIFTESGQLAIKFHVVDPNDPNNTVELANNQFTSTTSGDITTFNIADGVDCIALTYGPDLLWQHDPNQRGGKHPKSLDYNKSTDTLVLKFDGLDMSFAKNADGEWVYTETATSRSKRASSPTLLASSPKSRVKLLKVNPRNAANPLELSANEYTSTATGNVVTYKIARNVNCVKLMFGYVILWEYDPNQRGGIYPRSVYHDTTNNVLVLRFTGLAMTFENTSEGWIFTESGQLAIKFHVVDPNDPNNTVELANNQFTSTTSGDITTFNINSGVNPSSLTYGPALLWQHDPNQRGGIYPKSLDYNKSTDTLVLKFEGLDIKFAKNTEGGWEYTETQTSGSGAASTP